MLICGSIRYQRIASALSHLWFVHIDCMIAMAPLLSPMPWSLLRSNRPCTYKTVFKRADLGISICTGPRLSTVAATPTGRQNCVTVGMVVMGLDKAYSCWSAMKSQVKTWQLKADDLSPSIRWCRWHTGHWKYQVCWFCSWRLRRIWNSLHFRRPPLHCYQPNMNGSLSLKKFTRWP